MISPSRAQDGLARTLGFVSIFLCFVSLLLHAASSRVKSSPGKEPSSIPSLSPKGSGTRDPPALPVNNQPTSETTRINGIAPLKANSGKTTQANSWGLRHLTPYAFSVGENPIVEVNTFETDQGLVAQTELVVPLDPGLGEILAVEIDKPAVGIPGQLRIWCIVDDYYQNVSALRICLAKRILGPEEPVPEQMVDQPTSDTLPRIVLVHAVKLQGD